MLVDVSPPSGAERAFDIDLGSSIEWRIRPVWLRHENALDTSRVETCLDEDVMLSLLARRATNLAEVESHLDRCAECRGVFAELVRASRPPSAVASSVPRARITRGTGASSDRVDPRRTTAAADPPRPGETVADRFVLERSLGEGAAGIVFAAHDLTDAAPRALKFLRTSSAEHVRRLRREAAVLQAIRHPSIVFAHDIVETERHGPALVMELLHGESLEERLAGGRTLDLAELAFITRDILSALGAAHARGVVHRDLKPANVFLVRDPDTTRVRVLDFGMAKLDLAWRSEGLTPAITRSGTVMGTPLYMAPEQVFCERIIDGRADLYSLGVILYRALAGRLPVEAHTFAGLMKVLSTGTVRLLPPSPGVPHDVRDRVDRLLSVRPELRPSSEEILAAFAPHARPAGESHE